MTLREVLRCALLLRCESIEDDDGNWMRAASYPELGLEVQAEGLVQAMERLEVERVRRIIEDPSIAFELSSRRPALPDPVSEELLRRAGLAYLIPRLDEDLPIDASARSSRGQEHQITGSG